MIKSEFEKLEFEKKIEHFHNVCKRALPLWGYPSDTTIKLLNFTENATFCLTSAGLPKQIMRVHRIEYAEVDNIRTELQWIIDLKKDTNLDLATPIKSIHGDFVQVIETPELNEQRKVVCFEFLEGKTPVDTSDGNENVGDIIKKVAKIPNAITLPAFRLAASSDIKLGKFKRSKLTVEDKKLYQKVGTIAATLHNHSMQWEAPNFYKRMEWNFDGSFKEGDNNYYGHIYRSDKWLSKKENRILEECVSVIKSRLESYGKGPCRYGMIHSDLRIANLHQNGSKFYTLDFDDCGQGWFMYDIAGAVGLIEHRPDLQDVVKEIIKGYSTLRAISDADKKEIWTFIMMRRIGLFQTIMPRVDEVVAGQGESVELSPEIMAYLAKGTVLLAKQYLKEYGVPSIPTQWDTDFSSYQKN